MMEEATAESPNKILPEELIIEILSRVELTNLLQLRCVCKLWKSLIVDPPFTKNFIHRLFDDIADLSSKGKQHVLAFKSKLLINNPTIPQQQNVVEEGKRTKIEVLRNEITEMLKKEVTEMSKNKVTEMLKKKITESDTVLEIVRSLKASGNVESIEEGIVAMKDRMNLVRSFL